MTSSRLAASAALVLAAAAAPAWAQTGWGMIGEKEISPQGGSDSIVVRSDDPVGELMFCIEQAPVRFRAITIRFRSGATQRIDLRDRLGAGRCGRAIAVRSRGGPVAAIDITYVPDSLGGANARVQAFSR